MVKKRPAPAVKPAAAVPNSPEYWTLLVPNVERLSGLQVPQIRAFAKHRFGMTFRVGSTRGSMINQIADAWFAEDAKRATPATVPTKTQAAVIAYFNGASAPKMRTPQSSYNVCERNGWIVKHEAWPYYLTTQAGADAIGAPLSEHFIGEGRSGGKKIIHTGRPMNVTQEERDNAHGLAQIVSPGWTGPLMTETADAKPAEVLDAADIKIGDVIRILPTDGIPYGKHTTAARKIRTVIEVTQAKWDKNTILVSGERFYVDGVTPMTGAYDGAYIVGPEGVMWEMVKRAPEPAATETPEDKPTVDDAEVTPALAYKAALQKCRQAGIPDKVLRVSQDHVKMIGYAAETRYLTDVMLADPEHYK